MNSLAPSAVILLNNEINEDGLAIIRKQLFIDEQISGAEFDSRLSSDPDYITKVHIAQKKILVVRSFTEPQNREKMDLVLFFANGLISIEKSVFQSPPYASFPVASATLSQILQYRV